MEGVANNDPFVVLKGNSDPIVVTNSCTVLYTSLFKPSDRENSLVCLCQQTGVPSIVNVTVQDSKEAIRITRPKAFISVEAALTRGYMTKTLLSDEWQFSILSTVIQNDETIGYKSDQTSSAAEFVLTLELKPGLKLPLLDAVRSPPDQRATPENNPAYSSTSFANFNASEIASGQSSCGNIYAKMTPSTTVVKTVSPSEDFVEFFAAGGMKAAATYHLAYVKKNAITRTWICSFDVAKNSVFPVMMVEQKFGFYLEVSKGSYEFSDAQRNSPVVYKYPNLPAFDHSVLTGDNGFVYASDSFKWVPSMKS